MLYVQLVRFRLRGLMFVYAHGDLSLEISPRTPYESLYSWMTGDSAPLAGQQTVHVYYSIIRTLSDHGKDYTIVVVCSWIQADRQTVSRAHTPMFPIIRYCCWPQWTKILLHPGQISRGIKYLEWNETDWPRMSGDLFFWLMIFMRLLFFLFF